MSKPGLSDEQVVRFHKLTTELASQLEQMYSETLEVEPANSTAFDRMARAAKAVGSLNSFLENQYTARRLGGRKR